MAERATPFNIEDDLPWSPPSPSVATRRPGARSTRSARVTVVSPQCVEVERENDVVVFPRGVEILAESDTEAKAAYALLAHPEVVGLREQPAAVCYVDDEGVTRSHTLDFIAIHRDGSRTAVLVKPKALAVRVELDELVRTFAETLPKRVADRFVLLTEENLDADRVHDAKLINAARLHPRRDHDEAVLAQARRANGELTVAALMGMADLGGSGFRAIARLIGAGSLKRLDAGRLTHASRVAVADLAGEPRP